MSTDVPLDCVLDASVGIKLFVPEALSANAHVLLARLAADPPARLFVPDLFYLECANVLWKHTRQFGLTAKRARSFIAQLGLLALRAVPAAELMLDALGIAIARGITTYDAAYVALAARLSVPLITADQRLIRVLADGPCRLCWLGDLPAAAGASAQTGQ